MNMKQEPENLTARESLDIIAAMILQAKGNVQRNNFFFLFWGWVVVLANLGMYVLDEINYQRPYAIWLITVPAWAYTLYKIFTRRKEARTTSHFDRISAYLWISYGVTIFSLVLCGYKINFQLNPVILAISAIPTIVSGVILNFRPLIVGGITFWLSALVAFLVPMQTQPLVGAIAIACGYLIPGYMLKIRQD
jgi:hypothetical protein